MEKGYLEIQKVFFSVLFNNFSIPFLGHPVTLGLAHSYKLQFCLFWGPSALSRNDGLLLSAPCKSRHPELNAIFPRRICWLCVQVHFTAFVPGSVLLSITLALGNHIILLHVVAHCHPEPVRPFNVCCCSRGSHLSTSEEARVCVHVCILN